MQNVVNQIKQLSWVWYAPLFLFAVFLLTVLVGRSDSADVAAKNSLKASNILISGHNYRNWDDIDVTEQKLQLHSWDAAILAGDVIGPAGSADSLQRINNSFTRVAPVVGLLAGEKDASVEGFQSTQQLIELDYARVLLLDTVSSEECRLTSGQENFIKEVVSERDSRPLLLVTHHAVWGDIASTLKLNPSSQDCSQENWTDTVLPLFEGRLAAAISGDGGQNTTFAQEEVNEVRYVLTGSPDATDTDGNRISKLISMLRVEVNEQGDIAINTFNMGNTQLVDEAALVEVPTYSVTVKDTDLKDAYQNSPFYDSSKLWYEMIESTPMNDKIQSEIEATVSLAGGESDRDALVSIRGNIGNHWSANKKSWDIEFTDRDDRQLKFVIPDDRGYVNQLLIQEMADAAGTITPEITVGRLLINGIDFGVYLVYEDFDKAFVELNDFNSDALVSKNTFVDQYGFYDVLYDLSLGEVSGSKGDFSDQQNIANGLLSPDTINSYFDQDSFARWLALQIYTGDRHQNNNDNFRYVLDRASGRMTMLTWDVYLQRIPEASPIPERQPQSVFWANAENQALTKKYVAELQGSTDAFRATLAELERDIAPLFQNDAGLVSRESTIGSQRTNFETILDYNQEKLTEILGSSN